MDIITLKKLRHSDIDSIDNNSIVFPYNDKFYLFSKEIPNVLNEIDRYEIQYKFSSKLKRIRPITSYDVGFMSFFEAGNWVYIWNIEILAEEFRGVGKDGDMINFKIYWNILEKKEMDPALYNELIIRHYGHKKDYYLVVDYYTCCTNFIYTEEEFEELFN